MRTRRRIIVALLGLAVLLGAFLLVKIEPARQEPPIDIHAEGSERALARSVLENELRKLFRGSNGSWQVVGRPRSRCPSRLSLGSIGRAETTTYEFSRRVGVVLSDSVYLSSAAARRAFNAIELRHEEACRATIFAEELLHRGYGVGEARRFSSDRVRIADAGRSAHFEVLSHFRGRPYTWHLDSTAVLRGRMVVVAASAAGRSLAERDRQMARDLATTAGSQR